MYVMNRGGCRMVGNVETNSGATVGLTLGILSLVLPLIGLVLGIIGIIFSRKATKEIDRTSETGEGLATAGMTCSMVGIVVQIWVILSLISFFVLTTSYTVV